jgi:hypothetical protein
MICDFCAAPDPVWSFSAKPFQIQYVPGLTGESDTGWAACELCHSDRRRSSRQIQ